MARPSSAAYMAGTYTCLWRVRNLLLKIFAERNQEMKNSLNKFISRTDSWWISIIVVIQSKVFFPFFFLVSSTLNDLVQLSLHLGHMLPVTLLTVLLWGCLPRVFKRAKFLPNTKPLQVLPLPYHHPRAITASLGNFIVFFFFFSCPDLSIT